MTAQLFIVSWVTSVLCTIIALVCANWAVCRRKLRGWPSVLLLELMACAAAALIIGILHAALPAMPDRLMLSIWLGLVMGTYMGSLRAVMPVGDAKR